MGWLNGIFLVLCLILASCATTRSSGVNKHLIIQDVPKVSLPYRVVVDKESGRTESGTFEDRSGLLYSPTDHALGNLFGLAGLAADRAIASATGQPDRVSEKQSRGAFLGGEAFDGAVHLISSEREDGAVLSFQLVRFQPVLRENCYPGCPKLDFDLQFIATFAETGNSTTAYYSFNYPTRFWWFFGAEKEKDVLREMTEFALTHWAQRLLEGAPAGGQAGVFPPEKSDKDPFGKGQCYYNIFVRTGS